MKIGLLITIMAITNLVNAQWQSKGPYGGSVTGFAVMNNNIFVITNSAGIFKSIDNGANWVSANNGLSRNSINDIAVKEKTVFIATNVGLLKSVDSGGSWLPVNIAPNAINVVTVSAIGDTVFAGLNAFVGGIGTGGVFYSVDDGESWKIDNNGLPFQQFISVDHIVFCDKSIFIAANAGLFSKKLRDTTWNNVEIEMNPTVLKFNVSGNSVFASTTVKGEFVTSNYGKSWEKVLPPSATDTNFTVIMANKNTVYAKGNLGFYSSIDNGNNWNLVSDNTTRLFKSGSVFSIITHGNYMLAATSVGVLVSADGGKNWTDSNKGLLSMSIKSLTYRNNNLLAAHNNRIILSTNKGNTWEDASIYGASNYLNTFFVGYDSLWAGSKGGMYSSTNSGKSWLIQNNSLTDKSVLSFASTGNNMYAGTYIYGIFTSVDKGKNWVERNTGLTNKNVNTILANDSVIFLGTNSGVFRSFNNGTSWWLIDIGHKGKYKTVNSLVAVNNKIFAATTDSGVFVSSNNGNTWAMANTGLKSKNRTAITFIVYQNIIFVGTTGGAFMSNNEGKTWVEIDEGFPSNIIISSFYIDDNILYAGTNAGVWSRPLADLGINGLENTVNTHTLKIYPNPVKNYLYLTSENTKIKKATIYNYTGKLVSQHNLEDDRVNVEQLTPGLYFLQAIDIKENLYTARFLKD